MAYSKEDIQVHLSSLKLLYHDDLVYPTRIGCVMNLPDPEYQYIRIDVKRNQIYIKPYSTIEHKLLKHKEGREIWNDNIKKHINIDKLIDKI